MKKKLSKILKVLAAAVLALAVMEVILRLAVTYPIPLRLDPNLGWIAREGSLLIDGTEGYGVSRAGQYGWRGGHIPPVPDGGFRILVIGDSITEAMQVRDEVTFCNQLEQRLREAHPGVQVVNAGSSGWSMPDVLGNAAFFEEKLDPDLVVVQAAWRDLTSNAIGKGQGFWEIAGEGKDIHLVQNDPSGGRVLTNPILGPLYCHSALARYGLFRLKLYLGQKQDAPPKKEGKPEVKSPEVPQIERDRADWELRELAARFPVPVVLLDVPGYPAVNSNGIAIEPPPIEQEQRRVYRALAKKHHLTYVRQASFYGLYASDQEFGRGFSRHNPATGHLNPRGHALIADALAQALEPIINREAPAAP
ncbi:hypothetical protein KQI84_18050 [bacterium]|nr:hypothetical protein [bacterium]